ncbi:diguanylate cyclase (GGDEF) domain-containing protein [Lentzea jiangxiensis]|uniref:Diguanylate cyclase (GGDEF) domain-containing protein n=1 Tax=Lentzea jiangxiensis TaxID=641025 RepID=A0A1H0RPJ9_9PSEU|nr:diguanylate cyclase (GGDEF) domain-containing protein [Lentzea jiangxiensis]
MQHAPDSDDANWGELTGDSRERVGGHVAEPSSGRVLRNVRVLTNVFAWLGGIGLATQLLFADNAFAAKAVLLLLLLVVLGSWRWPDRDRWVIAAVEAAVLAGSVLVLPAPQPAVAFLFGVVTRRALGGGSSRALVKAVPALVGYLAGQGVLAVAAVRAGSVAFDGLVPRLMPLLGLVIGSAALHATVRAVRHEQDARQAVHAVIDASPVGMLLVDDAGTTLLSNARAHSMFGRQNGLCQVLCIHRNNVVRCEKCRGATGPFELNTDGAVLEVHTAKVPQESRPELTLVVAVDVSERRRQEDALRVRAEQDDLTGLASRPHFLHLLEEALGTGEPVGLLVIDLDQFKEINDSDGHHAGDEYLREFARRTAPAVPPGATAARLGGDEFAVLAPQSGADRSAELAGRVLRALATGPEREMRASIGVAVSAPGTTAAELLRDADAAMYIAKQEGGARAKAFHDEIGARVQARQRDKADLRAAVHGGQMVVHYQPIIELATSHVTGAEALVRWRRPGRGLVRPDEFIGLAEETGLIVPLGAQVLEAACAQGARWSSEGRALGVTVNVSTRQLSSAGFEASLLHALRVTGMPPENLTLEVTESVWADDAAMQGLMAVRDSGIRVALDDFGTGYSSLSYLQRYPFDFVKIDKSFVAALGETGRTAGVLRCVIDLADVLGARAIAEGVETPEQAEWLRREGCAYAQGYLFGRPRHPDGWDDQPAARGARPVRS